MTQIRFRPNDPNPILPAGRAGTLSRSATDRRSTVVTSIHARRSDGVAMGGRRGDDLNSRMRTWWAR